MTPANLHGHLDLLLSDGTAPGLGPTRGWSACSRILHYFGVKEAEGGEVVKVRVFFKGHGVGADLFRQNTRLECLYCSPFWR